MSKDLSQPTLGVCNEKEVSFHSQKKQKIISNFQNTFLKKI